MSVNIARRSCRRGISRYCVWFSSGFPMEFLIQSAPRPQTREWQVLFARSLADALLKWADRNEEKR